jgi:ElaB/YqjD/DUF883 family membrane-anchored ribosome-binding protein
MNASDELQNAYQEWRRLAKAEGEAIRAGDWSLVSDCQNAMQKIQGRIMHCTEEARREWARLGAEGAAREKSVRTLITELIDIERQNNTLLDTVRQTAQTQLGELKQAGHTLRQVQRSYAPARPPVWTSFS